jgi:hypothetical protein
MDNYFVVKELPDASFGTEVFWDKDANAYFYNKSAFVSPHQRNYLTAGQVTQTPEYFCKGSEFLSLYAYLRPTYSRKEIMQLVDKCFKHTTMELYTFMDELKELGVVNAEKYGLR